MDRFGTDRARRAPWRASTRLLAALVEHGEDHLLLLDEDRSIRYASPMMVELMTGFGLESILGRPLPDVVVVHDAGVTERRIDALHPGETLRDQHLRLGHADGSWVDMLGTRTDLTDDPDVGGILWSLRPITDERLESERSRAFAAGSSDVPFVLGADGVVTYVGPSIAAVFGLVASHLIGRQAVEMVHPDDADVLERLLAAARRGEPSTARFRLRNGAGEWRSIATVLDNHLDNPWIRGMVGHLRDVTPQTAAADALAASERRYRRILETTAEGVWILDEQGRTTFVNEMALSMGAVVASGDQRSGPVVGRRFLDCVVDNDRRDVERHLHEVAPGRSRRFETALVRDGAGPIEVLASVSAVTEEDGTRDGTLIMLADITTRKRLERELSRLALHDLLTGLPNRALLLDRVEQALVREGRRAGTTAALLVDIDSFELWNELLGHTGGDNVLVAVAERLRATVRTEDTVARLGDDEFVVLAADITGPTAAVELADRILAAIALPGRFAGRDVELTASVGIALTPVADSDTLLAHARTATNRAGRAGGARCLLYDEGSQAPAQLRLTSVSELRRAVGEGQLRVHYQPTVELDGRLTSFEALVRWQHPTRGLLAPTDFIGLAEDTGLIGDIGVFVLDQACADLSRWQAPARYRKLRMAVNLSAHQLGGAGVVDQVAEATERHHVDPSTLEIEITESVWMDDTGRTTANVEALSRLGCMLSVDDFGTGYSSLLYLKRFPIGALKLDASFVAGLGEQVDDMIIVRSIVDLAHKLGLTAIGEGVETLRQASILRELGCDLAQGYLWARPMRAADMDVHFAAAADHVTFEPRPAQNAGSVSSWRRGEARPDRGASGTPAPPPTGTGPRD